jgi:hypothetical protein
LAERNVAAINASVVSGLRREANVRFGNGVKECHLAFIPAQPAQRQQRQRSQQFDPQQARHG